MLSLAFPPTKLNPPKKKRHAHQYQACRDMDAAFDRGFQDVLLRGSTGVGKTLTLSGYAMEQAISQPAKRVVIAMGLTTLPDQWRDALIDLGYPAHEIGSVGDGKVVNPEAHISIVMVKTLANRLHVLEAMQPDMVIVDEAHELYFDKFLDRLREREWSKAKWVWATATPWRLNKREAFTRVNKDAVVEILGSMRDVINAGYLVPIRLFNRGGFTDIAKLELTSNDTLRAVDAAKLKTPEFLEGCIKDIWSYSDRYRAAGLCVDIEQCELVAQAWNELHPDKPATVLHSDLKEKDWEGRLTGWQSGKYWIAFSVEQFLVGFDYPPLDLLSWLRPTASPNVWIQGCGRAARLSAKTDKVDAIILDHVGNRLRIGHPLTVAEKPPQLEPNTKEKRIPEKQCPTCEEVVFSFVSVCPCCGHHFGGSQLEIDGGEEMPMGEVPDPILIDALTQARGQLKAAYTSWVNESKTIKRDKIINQLASKFPAEHMTGNLYRWLQGAVFRGDASPVAQYEMLRYLNTLQPCNPNWVLHHFAVEFGFRVADSAAVSPFQLLGLPDGSPIEWVERRYQLLVAQYQLELNTSRLLEWAYRQALLLAEEDERLAS